MSDPVTRGEITSEGVISLLAEIEDRRTSGVLLFMSGDLEGEVCLIAGQLALEQEEMGDGRDPVEVFLELRDGTYELYQRLPPLPVSHGDDKVREGSLGVHVPADLMNYCEAAGLTGRLHLEFDGRTAEALYARGELTDIRVDGTEDEDLHDVFGWTTGRFEITAHSIAPTLEVDDFPEIEVLDEEVSEEVDDPEEHFEKEPTIQFQRRRAGDTSEIFLRSVEVALTDIMEEREKRRGAEAPPESVLPQPRSLSPEAEQQVVRLHATRKRKRQATVRIVYSTNRNPEEALGSTRHVAKGKAREEALPEAAPERISEDSVGKKKKRKVRQKKRAQGMAVVTPPKAKAEAAAEEGGPSEEPPAPAPRPPSNPLVALGWAAAVFALMVIALVILARLPPLG